MWFLEKIQFIKWCESISTLVWWQVYISSLESLLHRTQGCSTEKRLIKTKCMIVALNQRACTVRSILFLLCLITGRSANRCICVLRRRLRTAMMSAPCQPRTILFFFFFPHFRFTSACQCDNLLTTWWHNEVLWSSTVVAALSIVSVVTNVLLFVNVMAITISRLLGYFIWGTPWKAPALSTVFHFRMLGVSSFRFLAHYWWNELHLQV